MGINKNLNVDPYYDDFNEEKQFNRILFKPSKAVQARELTQLQTILQKQVERFGSNVYKEGTIISGVNLTTRDDLFFVKVKDQPGFTNPALYNEIVGDDGSTTRFVLRGQDSGLIAEVVKGLPGFETSAPNLKTFYITYLNTTNDGTRDVKQFGPGELIELLDRDLAPVVDVNGDAIAFTTASDSQNQVGRAYGISCEEGVIFQRGHFIYVDRQLIIVTRYSNIPGQDGLDPEDVDKINPVSVGFDIQENIVNSNLDNTLLDNANGFNNYQAPGADRLQLIPTLASYNTSSEPTDFFALIRYVDGKTIRLRDRTELNVLGEELARRTYDESGHYVLSGYNASLENDNAIPKVSISPGKAYIFGKEVRNLQTKKIEIPPLTARQVKEHELTTVQYDQHYLFDLSSNSQAEAGDWPTTVAFDISGGVSNVLAQYNLVGQTSSPDNNQIIGTCNINNIGDGKVFVFNIKKKDGMEAVSPSHIAPPDYVQGASVATGCLPLKYVTDADAIGNKRYLGLQNQSEGVMIFDTGKLSLDSIESVNVVRRERIEGKQLGADGAASRTTNIPTTGSNTNPHVPQRSTDVVGITTTGTPAKQRIVKPTSIDQLPDSNLVGRSDGISVEFGSSTGVSATQTFDYIYYNKRYMDVAPDTLTPTVGYIKTSYSTASRTADLGVPNVIKVLRILTDDGNGTLEDVTKKFRLVNNQKDTFYDLSYIQLKQGQSQLAVTELIVEIKYLNRTYSGGYLVANSYSSVTDEDKALIGRYTAKNVKSYNVLNCFDLRPYARMKVEGVSNLLSEVKQVNAGVDLTDSGQAYLGQIGIDHPPSIVRYSDFANGFTINSKQSYFLARLDTVVLDEYGNMSIVTGVESESPVAPPIGKEYKLADIIVPSSTTEITGKDGIKLKGATQRNYKMSDISTLETKIDNLTSLVTLSLAEQDAKNMLITGSDGVDRFKNGIMADSFKDLGGADIGDPQFSASINKTRTVATPKLRQFPVDLKIDESSAGTVNVSDNSSEFTFENFTTLQPERTVDFLTQPFATDFRSCVSNYYNYQGVADIYPKFDVGYDVTQNPDINFEVDFATPLLDLVDNIQQLIPLTREGEITEVHNERTWERLAWPDFPQRPTWMTRVDSFTEMQDITNLVSSESSTTQVVGNFVTDISMKPFVRSQNVQILVGGLRPNTRHYFYFDEKDVNAHVGPVYDVNNMLIPDYLTRSKQLTKYANLNTKGRAVYSDANGRLVAQFRIPKNTFYSGENLLEISDVDQYSSIDSGGASYARASHRGYAFGIEKSELNATTRTVDFDTQTDTVVLREFQRLRRDPIAQTFRTSSAMVKEASYMYVSDLQVHFKSKSSTAGVTVQIRETQNGLPTKNVLPGATVTLRPHLVNVSDDGRTPTRFTFDDPIKLKADEEYCFVIIPEGNSPDYLVWTSKVGNTSKSKGTLSSQVAVTNDWGDGVLFTSTNDSAWKSYQDEDIKFTLSRLEFKTSGSIDLVPNDIEFLDVRLNKAVKPENESNESIVDIVDFTPGEIVYSGSSTNTTGTITPDTPVSMDLSGPANAPNLLRIRTTELTDFQVNDSVLIELGAQKTVATIEGSRLDGEFTEYTISGAFFSIPTGQTPSVSVTLVVSGIVSHYDPKDPTRLQIKESSARGMVAGTSNFLDNSATRDSFGGFDVGQVYTITDLGDNPVNINDRKLAWQSVGVPVGKEVVGTKFVCTDEGTSDSTASSGYGDGEARPHHRAIIGLESGAEATITEVTEEVISYFQPQITIDNSITSSTALRLKEYDDENDNTVQSRPVSITSNNYSPVDVRKLVSKSKRIKENLSEDFVISTTLNTTNNATTPMIDVDVSELNVYQYDLTQDDTTSSNWITKEVILDKDLPAVGLHAVVDAYRPPGTNFSVYGRFTYVDNPDLKTDWVKLIHHPENERLFSSSDNISDFKTYKFDLSEVPTSENSFLGEEFATFQIRLTLRHMTDIDINNVPEMEITDVDRQINTFVHFNKLTAVAVT